MFLPGESPGRGSLVGCRLWGGTESDTTEALAAAAESIYNAVFVPGVQQSDSVVYIAMSDPLQSLFLCRLL